MTNKRYSFSFTAASALIAETLVIAEEYQKLKDWKDVERSLLDNNLLNRIKRSTFKRQFSEIKKRLTNLTPEQLWLMINGSYDDAKAIILLSLVKSYALLKDFIVEVLRNKHLLFEKTLSESDYQKFINSKILIYSELNAITESTAKKVKRVIFTLLVQTGLVSKVRNGIILKPTLSNEVLKVIASENPKWLACFLFSNEEIKSIHIM